MISPAPYDQSQKYLIVILSHHLLSLALNSDNPMVNFVDMECTCAWRCLCVYGHHDHQWQWEVAVEDT